MTSVLFRLYTFSFELLGETLDLACEIGFSRSSVVDEILQLCHPVLKTFEFEGVRGFAFFAFGTRGSVGGSGGVGVGQVRGEMLEATRFPGEGGSVVFVQGSSMHEMERGLGEIRQRERRVERGADLRRASLSTARALSLLAT
jgi:hypothetical protein